jgi:hypothetical protein
LHRIEYLNLNKAASILTLDFIMDGLAIFSNPTKLIELTFHLFRHVSASRSFANIAGNIQALIQEAASKANDLQLGYSMY